MQLKLSRNRHCKKQIGKLYARPYSPPLLFRKIVRGALWRMNKKEKKIYLTFDDGPVPSVTTDVLSILKSLMSKQLFFVLVKM